MDRQVTSHLMGQTPTVVERKSDRELIVTRMFDAPAAMLFKAWSQPDLFRKWWVPKSATGVTLLSCKMDVRTGGSYRLEFAAGPSDTMVFLGKYLDVVPNQRIVWTNDEGDEGAITTVTFQERDGKTLLTFHELYPSRKALEAAIAGSAAALAEQFEQLDELLFARA